LRPDQNNKEKLEREGADNTHQIFKSSLKNYLKNKKERRKLKKEKLPSTLPKRNGE
jgi:hypothetical protein